MRLALIALAALAIPFPALAQTFPTPGLDNPRLQTVEWHPDQTIVLTALPATGLTVVLEPGETIQRIATGDQSAMDVHVSAEGDGFMLVPRRGGDLGRLEVETDRRSYRFDVRTGEDLLAAYLVRFEYGAQPYQAAVPIDPAPDGIEEVWSWQLRGERSVRPLGVFDDGERIFVEFDPAAPLPAIFAIGPTGDEQLVNGYMRGGKFVIDRLWRELVFRIDKDRARAERGHGPETDGG